MVEEYVEDELADNLYDEKRLSQADALASRTHPCVFKIKYRSIAAQVTLYLTRCKRMQHTWTASG